MKFVGRLTDIGIAKEGTRGTSAASATFFLPKTSLSVDDGIEQAVSESSVGVIEDSTNAVVVSKFAEGDVEGHIFDKSFGLLLLAALGAVSSSGPAQTNVYTHSFTAGQSAQHPSLTLFLNDPNQGYKYALAMLKSLDIDVMLGAYAKYKASFRSKAGATATVTPSYTVENHFLPQHGAITTAANLAGLASGTAVGLRSVSLSIDKNVEDDRKIGSVDQADILNKQFAVSGSLELVFNDNSFKTEMLGDTAKALRIQLTNSDVTIGTSLNPQLTLDLAKVKFSKFERKYSNDDITTASVDFRGFYSIADAAMVKAQLVNTQTSY